MKSDSENIDPRLWWLVNAVYNGTNSEQEMLELESILDMDPDARAFYIDFLRVNNEIRWLVSAKERGIRFLNAQANTAKAEPSHSPVLDFLGEWARFFNQHSPLSYMLLFMVLCATVVGTVYVSTRKTAAEPMIAAQITRERDCQWSATSPAPAADELLCVGQQLRLDSGIVQLTYSNGATVLLQGPADYEIDSLNSGYLKFGKLTARCGTEQSRQFTIVTPNARFVDLGTEFGVMINNLCQAAIAVFAGKVKAEAKLAEGHWDTPVSLSAGESVVCVEKKFNPFVAQRNDFPALRPLPPPAPDTPYWHWLEITQNLQKRPDLVAYYDFEPDPGNPRVLVNRAPTGAMFNGEIRNASWVDGRFGGKSALKFAAADSGVFVTLPGKYEQITLIAWVKINAIRNYWNGLFMTNDFSITGQLHLEIKSDAHLAMYVQKNPAAEPIESDEPIPDDCLHRWCMIAAVIDRTGQVCSMYVDDMCILDQKRMSQISPIIIGPATIAGWLDKGNDPDDAMPIRNLACCMDSFLIFNSALTQDEIRRIFESGKP
jgi:Concanavalin A-like lectin/glucanases superfamily